MRRACWLGFALLVSAGALWQMTHEHQHDRYIDALYHILPVVIIWKTALREHAL